MNNKFIKKSSKKLILRIKTGHLNNKKVRLKNNGKYRKQLFEKLYKKLEKFMKNNEINSENLCKNR